MLVSMAEGLRDPTQVPQDARHARTSTGGGSRAIVVHAVSIADSGETRPVEETPTRPSPILVLLDDAPAVPDFLPEGADLDPADPTEEQVRRAIEQHVREALNHSPMEHCLLDLVESIQDAVVVIDRRSIVLHLNTRAVALLQTMTRRTGPFVGQPLASVFPPAASATLRPAIHEALVHAGASRVDDPERHRGLALEVAIFPHPQGATLLIRDVTERKDLEAELIETRLARARAEARLRAYDSEAPA
ncbi:MAG TPA: PAS domain-containing protein [Candidatus Thermoplasmatota archaeon]|nr:PAS domain-containing protein [Candidatus Thermoplasmatota archaeon]